MSKKSRHYCVVPSCKTNTLDESLKFFRVIHKKNTELTKQWVAAINRKNNNGTPWSPSENSRICHRHFENGEPDPKFGQPNSIPTLFLTKRAKKMPHSYNRNCEPPLPVSKFTVNMLIFGLTLI